MKIDTRPGPQAKYSKHIKEANLNLISLDTLKEIFDKHFSHPFLEKGVVKTKWVKSSTEKTLQVNIGRRDVWINEKGEVIASGTNLLWINELG